MPDTNTTFKRMYHVVVILIKIKFLRIDFCE